MKNIFNTCNFIKLNGLWVNAIRCLYLLEIRKKSFNYEIQVASSL